VNTNGTVIVESDGNFGTYDELNFCIEGSSTKLGKRKKDGRKKALREKDK